jgi:hypothetical protein
MAYADYTHCDVCDAKAFYDANVDWDESNTGHKAVLCKKCSLTHTVTILRVHPTQEAYDKVLAEKNGAYAERNKVLSLMARMALALGWKAGVGGHPESDTTWERDWMTILFIEIPGVDGGFVQCSWHFHDSEKHLLSHLPLYEKPWDGHGNEEKYRRVIEALR